MMAQDEKKILVIAEREDQKIANTSFELLRAGNDLSEKGGAKLCVAILGHDISTLADEIAFYADEVISIDNPLLKKSQTDLYTHALETLCKDINPDIILMGHTLDNLDIAPRLAHRLSAHIITDCINFDLDGNKDLTCTKPIYGDNAYVTFVVKAKPQIATLRPKALEPCEPRTIKGNIINFDVTLDESLVKTESVKIKPGESVSLDKAEFIVSGGRGIKDVEGLQVLNKLIETLKKFNSKVELGASRPLIDAGWLPSSRQVGLTGEKVSPEIYIAIAISGSSQHLSGMIGSKKIIAINKDETANIFNSADYGVVGKHENILPAFIRKLKELV